MRVELDNKTHFNEPGCEYKKFAYWSKKHVELYRPRLLKEHDHVA